MAMQLVKWRWFAVGAVVGGLVREVLARSAGTPETFADLIDHLPQATQRRPNPEAFMVTDVTINGRTLKSIYVTQASRIVWEETVPANAWLSVNLGVREEAWARPGDGVLFLVGISEGGKYDELLSLIVNPNGNAADRQWYPLLLDLSPYAGKAVEVIFNTRPGVDHSTPDNDLAVWGAPAIVTR
jgi:hypothetical protein